MANWVQRFINAIATHKADVSAHHAKTADTGEIVSGQFPLARMPRGGLNDVITGTGAGTDPVYAAPVGGGTYSAFESSLLEGHLVRPDHQGWTPTVVDTGITAEAPCQLYCATGVNANSSAMLSTSIRELNPATVSASRIDWDNPMIISFEVVRSISVATAEAWVQLKQANALGDLAALGVGINIDNLAMKSESYGIARGNIDFGLAMVTAWPYIVQIVLVPATSIKWYVNGVLKATESIANNIPTGEGLSYAVLAIENNATAALCYIHIVNFQIWQKILP